MAKFRVSVRVRGRSVAVTELSQVSLHSLIALTRSTDGIARRGSARRPQVRRGVPSNTSRPSLMKITRLHIASTSCRMCVESRIVFVSPRRRIVSRTSRIWFGSRPAVGSSRISTSGSCSSTWAMPTRWRKPFEACRSACRSPLPSLHRSITASIRSSICSRDSPRASPKNLAGSAASCRDTAGRSPAGSPSRFAPSSRSVAMLNPAIRAVPADGAR